MIIDEPEANEDAMVARIGQLMRDKLVKDYAPAATVRDAHPKHHGLLEAQFTVLPDLPPELRVGLFATARTHRAYVRTSNASGTPKSDAEKDLRGFAIKVLDVEGAKIPESDEPNTQDFILLSCPTMPLGTLKLFHDAIYYSFKWSIAVFAAKLLLTGQARVLKELAAARILPPSPLEIRYWSTTPYQFGTDRVVKYSILPTSGAPTTLPAHPGPDYLADAMERRLALEDVTFDFAVQLRTPNMSISDSAPRWDERQSPFHTVAKLTIPRQRFRTAERSALAEALSFSPGHALVEHRPVGSINRARMQIYRANATFRQQRRGVARVHG
ncbi:MAG TPA: catalase family protein [Polyangia bacterium]